MNPSIRLQRLHKNLKLCCEMPKNPKRETPKKMPQEHGHQQISYMDHRWGIPIEEIREESHRIRTNRKTCAKIREEFLSDRE